MATITIPYDVRTIAGGFVGKLLDNLPKPFSPSPKPVNALTFVPTVYAPAYPLLSIKNGMLYLHTEPLETVGYTPEVSFDLTAYNYVTLASALTAGGYGYTVYAASNLDGAQAVMLLGFTNYPLNGTDTLQAQAATSRLWKTLYPAAMALSMAGQDSDNGISSISLPFSSGFWLDFWGDWFDTPRLPGMNDMQYVAYLLWNNRVPKVNNMAIEDILEQQYQIPVQVSDTGSAQFTVYFYPSFMGQTPDVTPLVQKIKAAGTSFLVAYLASFTENYKTYLYNRYGWTDLSQMDIFRVSSVTVNQSEPKFGFLGNSFQLGGASGGNSQLNTSPMGAGSKLTDTFTMH